MRASSNVAGPVPGHEHAWPHDLCPADPWAGDEVIADPAPYEDYAHHAGGAAVDRCRWQAWDDTFLAAYRGVLDGREPWGATDEAAAMLRIDAPRRHDRRPASAAPQPTDDGILVVVVEDLVPDIGLLGPDRVFGPWADEGLPLAARRLAAAVLSFSPILSPRMRPVARAMRFKGLLTVAERAVIRAIHDAPPNLWLLDGGSLRPALPIGPQLVPAPPDRGPAACIARAVLGPEGTELACMLPVPPDIDHGRLLRRLDLEYQRLRRQDRRLTWEDLLRDRGEVLYRTAGEWCWLHRPEETRRCWSATGLSA